MVLLEASARLATSISWASPSDRALPEADDYPLRRRPKAPEPELPSNAIPAVCRSSALEAVIDLGRPGSRTVLDDAGGIMNGTLLRILETLPPAMRLQGKSRTWEVAKLIKDIQTGGRDSKDADARPYVLFRCQNGKHAIVLVHDDGSLSKMASYMEVT